MSSCNLTLAPNYLADQGEIGKDFALVGSDSVRVTSPVSYRFTYRREAQEPHSQDGTEILYYQDESAHPHLRRLESDFRSSDSGEVESRS